MKKQYVVTISLLMVIGQSSAMQPMVARTAGQLAKHYGKKSFAGIMTALHWTIAAGSSIMHGCKKIKELSDEEKALANYTNADETVTTFIASELENARNIKIDSVRISPKNPDDSTPFPIMEVFGNHVLLINSTTAKEITEDEKTHNKWRGLLGHEAIHSKKNDVYWSIAADLTMPFITHGSVKVIRNVLPIAKKTRSFLSEQLIKIPTAFGKDLITVLYKASLRKYQEQRADDDGVPNEIEKLTGMKEYLKDADDYRLDQIKQLFNVCDAQAENIDWARNFLESHPLPKKRIAKLDRRIELLKKQSEKNLDKSSINLDESLVVI